MPDAIHVGDRIRIYPASAFQNTADVAFDPEVVRFEVKPPNQSTITYVYGVDANVTKNGVGDYQCAIDVNTAGNWHYYVIGEQNDGENRGADQGSFYVEPKET